MSFWDILDTFSNLSLLGERDSRTKRPRIYILFYILLVPGIFCFVLEARSVFSLPSPVLFLGLLSVIGLILTAGTVVLIYKLKLIEKLSLADFFSIMIPITLLTISLASLISRTY